MSVRDSEAYERIVREIGAKYSHLYQGMSSSAPAKEFKLAPVDETNCNSSEVWCCF